MTALARGENRPAPGDRMIVTVACSAPVDVSALLRHGGRAHRHAARRGGQGGHYRQSRCARSGEVSLQTGIKRSDSFGLGRLVGRSTGEGMTLAFSGRGFVIVQPSELPPGGLFGGTGGGQQAGQSGGALGGLFR